MRKQWIALVAAMTAVSITACGNGDGIVINGTTAAEAESTQPEDSSGGVQETTSGTKIEIITGETTQAPETVPASTEGQTQAPASQTQAPVSQTQAPSTAAPTTQAPTQPETTAAKVYKVTDVKKTMYATASVRVRASYSTSSDVLAGLAKDEKVEVTGESENGWLRVNYKGNVGYVSKDYLTEKVPSTTQTESTGTRQPSTTNPTNPGTTNSAAANPGGKNPGTSTGPTGPTASNGGVTGPGGASNETTTPGGSTAPGGSATPGGSTAPGGATSPGAASSSSGGGSSVTGSVTALDPSGVTVQTSNGTSYQFIWGDSVPALAPGEKIQIFYETTSSGEKRVTSYSK